MKKLKLTMAMLLLGGMLATPAFGQFLGYNSPQGIQATVFAAQTTPATTPVFALNCTASNGNPCGVQNIGQTVHQITFTTSTASCIPDLRIEATFDGSTWFAISEDSQATGTGTLYAKGYFPGVRINLVATGSCAVTVFYAGTSAGEPTDQAIFNAAQKQTKVIFNQVSAAAQQTAYVYPPFANSSGLLVLNSTGTLPGGSCQLIVAGQFTGSVGQTTILSETLPSSGGPLIYLVPASPAYQINVTFEACGATATTFSISYLFNSLPLSTTSAAALTTSIGNFPNTGPLLVEKGARWSQVSAPAAGSQASASRSAALTTGTRHVADCVSLSAGAATAPTATVLTINLRDGATGTGTILWTTQVTAAATAANHGLFSVCGLNLPGSANTAMTLEFSGSLANEAESVTLTGYDAY